ncbi:MAG: glycosyltransferase family 39 protein [Candidatus Beckwithbacteria bacterium]|nr:glycosyltransferase family 39 protein [Candidatus Beckwithbacteria bacterium]
MVFALVLSLVVSLLLRLPSFFEPYSYADEGIYLVLGQAFKQGLVFYKDIHDNKPPLLYLTAALADNLTNFRLLLALVNWANLGLIWLLAKKLFKNNFRAVLAASLSFALLSGLTLLEGNIANGELFMIAPLTAAVYFIVKKRFWVAGLLAAIGFLYKVPVAFDLAGITLWLIWQSRDWWRSGLKLAAGFLGVNILVAAYYFKVGTGQRYLTAALLQNLPYLTSWGSGGGGGSIFQSGLFQRLVLLLVWSGLIFYFKKKLAPATALLGLWFGFSLYGVLLSERPYPHYWIEAVPVISLMIGGVLAQTAGARKLFLAGFLLAGISWFQFHFWSYPVKAYYNNFIKLISGQQDRLSYQRYWGNQVIDDQQTADFIREHTLDNERIFVWGTSPGIYYLSGRLPVGRYTVAYHVADFKAFEETMAALEQAQPRLIVNLTSEGLPFPRLTGLLAAKYQLVKTIADRQIYLRLIE